MFNLQIYIPTTVTKKQPQKTTPGDTLHLYFLLLEQILNYKYLEDYTARC